MMPSNAAITQLPQPENTQLAINQTATTKSLNLNWKLYELFLEGCGRVTTLP